MNNTTTKIIKVHGKNINDFFLYNLNQNTSPRIKFIQNKNLI